MRKIFSLSLITLLLCGCALAEPLAQLPDLQGSVAWPDEAEPVYTYTYAYPQVAGEGECQDAINAFYQYEEADTLEYRIPMKGETVLDPSLPAATDIRYTITANNDDYFCVLVISDTTMDGERHVSVSAQTFARSTEKPGCVMTLPYMLGILDDGEDNDWLKDRQTARANEVVRSLIWEQIKAMDSIPEGWSEDTLLYDFFPEEAFYYSGEDECLVFFFQPYLSGDADDPTHFYTFPLEIDDILDEM